MVQESIVEYINSQMKLGVSRDAIKATLTGAGWQQADVEDTLKKVEAGKAAPAQPMSAVKPMSTMSSGPQTIKVSDLVSASPSKPVSLSSTPITVSRNPMTGPATNIAGPTAVKSSNTYQAPGFVAGKTHGSRGALITDVVLVIIILIAGGLAGFLYIQNGSLNKQLGSLNGQSSGVNSQLSALQAQVTASTTALTADAATLTAETQELQTELSFYAVPPGATSGASVTVSFNGVVSGGGKTSYVITATYGAKIYVANSKTASVISALGALEAPAATSTTDTASTTATSTASSSRTGFGTPSVASSTTSTTPTTTTTTSTSVSAQFTGTYVPGSDSITLTAVNGTSL